MRHFNVQDRPMCGTGRVRAFFQRVFMRGICPACIVRFTFTARVRGAS